MVPGYQWDFAFLFDNFFPQESSGWSYLFKVPDGKQEMTLHVMLRQPNASNYSLHLTDDDLGEYQH